MPTTHYSIELKAGFDDDILWDLDLDTCGYVLESIIRKYFEAEKPELLEGVGSKIYHPFVHWEIGLYYKIAYGNVPYFSRANERSD